MGAVGDFVGVNVEAEGILVMPFAPAIGHPKNVFIREFDVYSRFEDPHIGVNQRGLRDPFGGEHSHANGLPIFKSRPYLIRQEWQARGKFIDPTDHLGAENGQIQIDPPGESSKSHLGSKNKASLLHNLSNIILLLLASEAGKVIMPINPRKISRENEGAGGREHTLKEKSISGVIEGLMTPSIGTVKLGLVPSADPMVFRAPRDGVLASFIEGGSGVCRVAADVVSKELGLHVFKYYTISKTDRT